MTIVRKASGVQIVLLAFLAYFLAESLLRQATISNINPQKVNVDSLVNCLPSTLRDAAVHRFETIALKEAVANAKTDEKRVMALDALASYSQDTDERVKIYGEVIRKYPDLIDSYPAYLFFIFSPDAPDSMKMTMKDYSKFLDRNDYAVSYKAWSAGLNSLKSRFASPDEIISYLSPLIEEPPAHNDYATFYRMLAEEAVKANRSDVAEKASAMKSLCAKMPSLKDIEKAKPKTKPKK